MGKVVQQINRLQRTISETLASPQHDIKDPSIGAGLFIYHQSVLRNKRCALAYLNHRRNQLIDLWWESGAVIPDEDRDNMSKYEVEFFEEYEKLVNDFISATDVDLTQDRCPPKDLFIEVRALKDYGEVVTEHGPVMLSRGSVHLMRRSDVELLIRQGVVEQTETKH